MKVVENRSEATVVTGPEAHADNVREIASEQIRQLRALIDDPSPASQALVVLFAGDSTVEGREGTLIQGGAAVMGDPNVLCSLVMTLLFEMGTDPTTTKHALMLMADAINARLGAENEQ